MTSNLDERSLRWMVMAAGGWEYLLPSRPGHRWLHVDASRGVTTLLLAGMCDELHVGAACSAHRTEIAALVRERGATNVRIASGNAHDGKAVRFPGVIDGFLLHDLGGVLDQGTAMRWLKAGAQHVSPDGFVYAGVRNRYGYTRIHRAGTDRTKVGGGAYFSLRDVRSIAAGGREVLLFPLICNYVGQITDVVPAGGYVSAKNPSLPKEILRRWVLGRRGAPLWSPGFAITARPPWQRTVLEHALDALAQNGCLLQPVEVARDLKRYHVLNGGKAVVSIGQCPGKFGSHILVLARSGQHIERRRHESRLLSQLASLPSELSARIPRFFFEVKIGDVHAFALQEFPGITLDAPVAGLRAATTEAVSILQRLHRATRRNVRLTLQSFASLYGGAFEAARCRYPLLADTLDRLQSALQRDLIGVEFPLVCMHGDFKIENVVLDERSGRLLGVIDWELSERESFPLLDLWYLILYNREIEDGESFLTAARNLLPPRRLAPRDAAVCAEYMRSMEVPPNLVPALYGALVLHHAARRMEYDPSDRDTMESLRQLLEGAASWVSRAKATSMATGTNAVSANA